MLSRAHDASLNCLVDSSAPLLLHFHARRSCCRLRAADERAPEVVVTNAANATPHEPGV